MDLAGIDRAGGLGVEAVLPYKGHALVVSGDRPGRDVVETARLETGEYHLQATQDMGF